ncbi:MAG: diphthine--ammonia ligase [Methanobacteriota archaeon]
MKLAALISGGKDSLYAMYLMVLQGHEIKYLLAVLPERTDSYMFHHPNAALAKLQAEAMGIRIVTKATSGEKEIELKDLRSLISCVKGEVEGIITGALASEYQKKRVERLCEELKLKSLAPLWHKDAESYWRELLSAGFEVIVTSVSAQGLDESWLGRKIDFQALEELKKLAKKYRFHLGFEGGEAETFVLDMPLFRKKIEVIKARKEWDGVRGVYIIEEARLAEKAA